MNTRSCSTCEFTVKNPKQELRRSGSLLQPEIPDTFSCRRFPPQFTITQGGGMFQFPNMLTEHWCGEWKHNNVGGPQ